MKKRPCSLVGSKLSHASDTLTTFQPFDRFSTAVLPFLPPPEQASLVFLGLLNCDEASVAVSETVSCSR